MNSRMIARVYLSGPKRIWMGSMGTTYLVMVKSPLDIASYNTLDVQYHGNVTLLILHCYCDRFIYQTGVMVLCIPPIVVHSNKRS